MCGHVSNVVATITFRTGPTDPEIGWLSSTNGSNQTFARAGELRQCPRWSLLSTLTPSRWEVPRGLAAHQSATLTCSHGTTPPARDSSRFRIPLGCRTTLPSRIRDMVRAVVTVGPDRPATTRRLCACLDNITLGRLHGDVVGATCVIAQHPQLAGSDHNRHRQSPPQPLKPLLALNDSRGSTLSACA